MRRIDADALSAFVGDLRSTLHKEQSTFKAMTESEFEMKDNMLLNFQYAIDNTPTVEVNQIEFKAYNEGFKDGVEQGIKLSEDAQDEWIPVSERLPEIAKSCLVQLSNGYITMGKYHSIRGGSWVFIDTTIQFAYPKDSVIAWQPLPERYKEGGAENER